jgi:hypothetical protein
MNRIVLYCLQRFCSRSSAAFAEDHGRIQKKPPTAEEVDRIASDRMTNDSSLYKGEIVRTDRGFFLFRGVALTNDFIRVLILCRSRKAAKLNFRQHSVVAHAK